jgi:hypothetical protein
VNSQLRPPCVAALLLVTLGCAGTPAPKTSAATPRSGHGYALLHQLLTQEKKVSMLLIIKGERKELERVIDAISETAADAAAELEGLADAAPPVDLRNTGLPGDEVRARESIAATRRDRLLAAEGRTLEFELLLSQNEALSYGIALTDALARNESNEARLAFVRALWKDLNRLQGDVLALLRAG